MTCVAVERSFDAAANYADLEALEDGIAWCLEQRGVRAVGSHLARDGRRMVCVYEAPDAEAVRQTQKTGKLAYDAIWPAFRIDALHFESRPGFCTVLFERDFPQAMTVETMHYSGLDTHGCLREHRTHWTHSFRGWPTRIVRIPGARCRPGADRQPTGRVGIRSRLARCHLWRAAFLVCDLLAFDPPGAAPDPHAIRDEVGAQRLGDRVLDPQAVRFGLVPDKPDRLRHTVLFGGYTLNYQYLFAGYIGFLVEGALFIIER